jgi:hypothetical protein
MISAPLAPIGASILLCRPDSHRDGIKDTGDSGRDRDEKTLCPASRTEKSMRDFYYFAYFKSE